MQPYEVIEVVSQRPGASILKCRSHVSGARVLVKSAEMAERDQLIQQHPLGVPCQDVKKLLFQLLLAVSCMHGHELIHQNVRPETLFIASDGCLKLGGFSKAVLVKSAAKGAGNIKCRDSMRWYRAPEQLVGDHYSQAVDIWAIGCIMAEMLTGRPLFPGKNDVDQLLLTIKLVGCSQRQLSIINGNKAFKDMVNHIPDGDEIEKRLKNVNLGKSGLQLLKACLHPDPSKRPSCQQLLGFSYFDKGVPELLGELGSAPASPLTAHPAGAAQASAAKHTSSQHSGTVGSPDYRARKVPASAPSSPLISSVSLRQRSSCDLLPHAPQPMHAPLKPPLATSRAASPSPPCRSPAVASLHSPPIADNKHPLLRFHSTRIPMSVPCGGANTGNGPAPCPSSGPAPFPTAIHQHPASPCDSSGVLLQSHSHLHVPDQLAAVFPQLLALSRSSSVSSQIDKPGPHSKPVLLERTPSSASSNLPCYSHADTDRAHQADSVSSSVGSGSRSGRPAEHSVCSRPGSVPTHANATGSPAAVLVPRTDTAQPHISSAHADSHTALPSQPATDASLFDARSSPMQQVITRRLGQINTGTTSTPASIRDPQGSAHVMAVNYSAHHSQCTPSPPSSQQRAVQQQKTSSKATFLDHDSFKLRTSVFADVQRSGLIAYSNSAPTLHQPTEWDAECAEQMHAELSMLKVQDSPRGPVPVQPFAARHSPPQHPWSPSHLRAASYPTTQDAAGTPLKNSAPENEAHSPTGDADQCINCLGLEDMFPSSNAAGVSPAGLQIQSCSQGTRGIRRRSHQTSECKQPAHVRRSPSDASDRITNDQSSSCLLNRRDASSCSGQSRTNSACQSMHRGIALLRNLSVHRRATDPGCGAA